MDNFRKGTLSAADAVKWLTGSTTALTAASAAASVAMIALTAGVAAIGAVFAGGAVATKKLWTETSRAREEIDKIAKISARLGMSTEGFIALSHAAELSGASANTLAMSMQRMTRRIAEASYGSGEAVNALRELQLSAQQLAGLAPEHQFAAIAEAMSKVGNQGDAVRLTMKLMDSEGVVLLNTLQQGGRVLEDNIKRTKELGISFSRLDAIKVEAANDAIAEMGKILQGIYRQLAIQIAPLIHIAAEEMTNFATDGLNGGKTVAEAMSWVTEGVGFMVNNLKAGQIQFLAFRAVFLGGLAAIAKGLSINARIMDGFLGLFGKSTGIGEFSKTLAEDLDRVAGEDARAAFRKTKELLDEPPSQQLRNWLKDVHARYDELADSMEKRSLGNILREAQQKADEPAHKLITSLQDQIRAVQLGSEAAEIYKLKEAGVSHVLIKQIAVMQRMLSERKEAADAQKKLTETITTTIDKYREQIRTLEMGADKAELYSLAQMGVGSATLKTIEALQRQKKELEEIEKLKEKATDLTEQFKDPVDKFHDRIKELLELKGQISKDVFRSAALDALPEKVKQIIESTKTPMQKFREQLKELEKFKNFLSPEQFAKARKALGDEFFKPKEFQLASSAEFGSQEARDTMFRTRFGGKSELSEMRDLQREQLAQSQQQTRHQEQIARKTRTRKEVHF